MYKIALEQLSGLFEALSNTHRLVAPIEKANQVKFYEWEQAAKVRLDCLSTTQSAKEFFLPQTEKIVSFKREGKKIEILPETDQTKPSIYFGVRACDVKSFEILDSVYLAEPVDTFYAQKRQLGTIISMACQKPERTCFCHAFHIDPSNPVGDVVTWIIGDTLYWNSVSEKGDFLTQSLKDLLEPAEDTAVQANQKEIQEAVTSLPIQTLPLEQFSADKLNELFDSPLWESLHKACLACGTCTFVCPTCQCYDICDYDCGGSVQRTRCWDSCMYADFTKMAHGNPRTSQLERFRQRFMHKLVYHPANHEGEFGCVGCGRCLQKCPISMNVVKVSKALGGHENE